MSRKQVGVESSVGWSAVVSGDCRAGVSRD